ncbi:hypothetical protein DdX_02410 [Ditylenchus destructor]|uniref:Uncharacterized protein n=1 Tax=Ditylenchus destructor TaxID=166010 RepID=A0AAD4RC01_9BILA|nr:hypothetical protein DdX_02410 [Ditylenchus destructor]
MDMAYFTKVALLLMLCAHISMSQKAPAGERCWDPFLKRFYLGTDTCSNSMSDYSCDILFDPDKVNNQQRIANGEPPVASPACDAPEYAEVALKCAKNCYICCERPEFTCKNPKTWMSSVPTKISAFYALMKLSKTEWPSCVQRLARNATN